VREKSIGNENGPRVGLWAPEGKVVKLMRGELMRGVLEGLVERTLALLVLASMQCHTLLPGDAQWAPGFSSCTSKERPGLEL
jgi:hypothetical protein